MTRWTDEEIISAMESNTHFHMTYFANKLPIMNLQPEPDVTVMMSEIADDTFNYVIRTRFEEKQAEERVSHVLKLFKNKNLPFSWWVSNRDRPLSLPSILEKQGLSPKEDSIGMSLFLDSFSFKRRIDELSIKRALNQEMLNDFAEVMVSIGGFP